MTELKVTSHPHALAARQPVEFDRAREPPRRQSAVELLLAMGYVWHSDRWEAPAPAAAAPVDNVYASPLLLADIWRTYGTDDLVVVSPQDVPEARNG